MSSDAGRPDATSAPLPEDSLPAYGQPAAESFPAGDYAPPNYPPPPYYAPAQGYPPPTGYSAPSGHHPGYPPPGYQQPGYQQPAAYGYPPPGYSPQALKPGVIPLRPLTMSDIFNASINYVRANPKATLGLTTIVVVISQVIALLIQIGPLAATGALTPLSSTSVEQGEVSDSAYVGMLLSSLAGSLATVLAGIVLSGLLTVVVGRAVFGAKITIGEAWQRVRGRLLALLAVTGLEAGGALLLIALVAGAIAAAVYIAGGAAGFVLGALLVLALIVLLAYLYTMLSFAPTLIVLERIGVMAAITRSFKLVKNDFWRVFGIRLLAVLIAGVISGAVAVPFSIVGQIMITVGESTTLIVIAFIVIAVGGAIGQIVTAPFNAGTVVLLYTDRRIRAEAFDLVLQTGTAVPPGARADSTDDLWLSPHR
ncbi:MAG: hypothetical protein ABW137_35295 [Mycobacterium sp.]